MRHNQPLHLAAVAATVCFAVGAASNTAEAVDVEVQITGLDLFFGFENRGNIQTGPSAGDVDQVESATFFVDGVPIQTIVGNIEANIGIPGFVIPAAGGTAMNELEFGYFNIDFDADTAGSGWLDLDLDEAFNVTAFYTGNELGISLFGTADALQSAQPIARVPGFPGFGPDDTITFSFVSSNLSNVEQDGHDLTKFRASGTGSIQGGNVVPEPTSIALAGMASVALLRRRRA